VDVVKLEEEKFSCTTRGVLRIIFCTSLENGTKAIEIRCKDVIFNLDRKLVEKYILTDEEERLIFKKMYQTKS